MTVTRTVKVKLSVPASAVSVLEETASRFRYCANQTSDWAWDDSGSCVTSIKAANQELYDSLKSNTGLHANLVQKAIGRGIEAVRSGVARKSNSQRTSKPRFNSNSIVYDKRAATFYRDRASLSTIEGRIECAYVLPDDPESPHQRYLLNSDFEFRTSTLHQRGSDWYLHATMQKPSSQPSSSEHRTVLGVDLGVNNLAVTSTGRFWSGAELHHWRREYERRRKSLQQCGTRWAHQAMKSVSSTETNHLAQYLHTLANELVDEARMYGCRVIALEELTDIRDRLSQASWHHIWAFRRLSEYVTYKAESYGISVDQVSPTYTSQRCSTCGYTDDQNRSQSTFRCLECGYENHADYNAAKNIGVQYLHGHQTGDDGGAPVGVRLNSGILSLDGINPVSTQKFE